jgi:hypothetical protein
MKGYEVFSLSDDKTIGHVVERSGDNLIVEHGTLRKTRNALPLELVEVDEAGERVVTSLSADLIHGSPKVEDGHVDAQAVAAYYGLTDTTVADPYPDDLRGSDAGDQEREQILEEESDTAPHAASSSPSLLGDHYSEAPHTDEE